MMKKDLDLVINQNHLVEEDQIDHQEIMTVRKKALVLKVRKVSLKKIETTQSQLALQIIQNILVKSH